MSDFQELLSRSVAYHGHLCPGQVLGVRLAMLGGALLGYDLPLGKIEIKKVVVFVEIDQCAADAIAVAVGVKLGRRSLKFKDYGLMAATFVNLPDGRAFRVAVREDCRARAGRYAPGLPEGAEREIQAYQVMPAAELFTAARVKVELRPEDLPGVHSLKAVCESCGALIRNRREVFSTGRTLCRVCAGDAYFTSLGPVGLDLNKILPARSESEAKARG
jgi:formylmethanofuran dehydrogenase subunit E